MYFDKNQDGDRDGADDGVEDATVSLRAESCARPASETVTTGSSGTFSWSGLSPGTWCVTLDSRPSGYIVTTTGSQYSFNLNSDRSVGFSLNTGS
ncbi:MAG: prealbumin-like fold domain-containing protein [Anaerolineales bacterium]